MIHDIATVAWKEWKLQFRQGESQFSARMKIGLLVVAGVVLSRQFGQAFSTSVASAGFGALFGCVSIIPGVAATFAGEREEKTLEWLLSTPLSEMAIILGKQVAIIAYALCFGCGLVVAGIAGSVLIGGAPFTPTAYMRILAATVALTLSSASVMSAVGMLVSLKAVTTRHALNALTFLVLCVAVAPLALAWIPGLPSLGRVPVPDLNSVGTMASIVLSAIIVNGALCTLIVIRFKRASMILERGWKHGGAS